MIGPSGRTTVSDRRLIRLAWVATALTAMVGIGALAFLFVPTRPGVPSVEVAPIQVIANGTFLLVTPVLALIIIRAQPRSPIGWLFMAFPLLLGVGFLGDNVARHLSPSPAVAWGTFVLSMLGGAFPVTLVSLLLLFPTGRLMSPRWRWILLILSVGALSQTTYAAVAPFPFQDVTDLPNPTGLSGLRGVLEPINTIGMLGILTALVAAVAQLAVRFRRARGVERQQLKWFVLAASVVGAFIVLAVVAEVAGAQGVAGLFWVAGISSIVLLPASAALAILRYRLYDIDRIISRTIAYALVSAILAIVFGGVILLLSTVLAQFAQGQTIAVAASTLAAYAVFQPVLQRVRRNVDRRFNRARYDAEQTAAAFSARMRNEVDIGAVTADLNATVHGAIKPASLALWIRENQR